MAALNPYLLERRVLVKNIPAKASCDKLVIHFQKKKHGGNGDVSSITYPKSSSEPDHAVIEFEDHMTMKSVAQHRPHHFNNQDLLVTEYPLQLGDTDARISATTIRKLGGQRSLIQAIFYIEETTGVKIDCKGDKYHVRGQWYQVSAAKERLESLLTPNSSRNSETKTDVKPAHTEEKKDHQQNEKSEQSLENPTNTVSSDSTIIHQAVVPITEAVLAYTKLQHPNMMTAIQKKFKVIIEEKKTECVIRPGAKGSKSDVDGGAQCLQEKCSKYNTASKSYFKLNDLPGVSTNEAQQAMDAIAKKFPKLYISLDTSKSHKHKIAFLSLSAAETNNAILQFGKICGAFSSNKQFFHHSFKGTGLKVIVNHGLISREKADAVAIETGTKSSNNKIMLAGGGKLQRELDEALKQPWQQGKLLQIACSEGSLQCESIILVLNDVSSTTVLDLKRVLLDIFIHAMKQRIQTIAIPADCIGLQLYPEEVDEQTSQAIANFNNQLLSIESDASLKEIIIVHHDASRATAIAYKLQIQLKNDTPSSSSSAAREDCAICLEEFSDDSQQLKTLPCKHVFHQPCIDKALHVSNKCPLCMTFFGKPEGNQPKNGTMTNQNYHSSLPGYNCSTIMIKYYFPGGIQGTEHPNPGQPYIGATRTAYLPDNVEGREVLYLLQKAFEARLVFTVGRSVTSGLDNCVTWNDIHHKTSMHGGPTNFGYPDPDYLQRMKQELAAKGIH